MKNHNIHHKYIKPGMVEFFVDIQGAKVILLTAKFEDFRDFQKLHQIAREELSMLNNALVKKAA